MIPISGYTVAHNIISGDYCLRECVTSLLGVCDEVVIGHATSDDGTGDLLSTWAREDSRIRVIEQPWTQPLNDIDWFTRWINVTRQHLAYPQQLMLDADEVIDPGAYDMLRNAPIHRCYWFKRLNYWRNIRTIIPHGKCCGHELARFGPSDLWMPSDEPRGHPPIRLRALHDPCLIIHHYGFLRRFEGIIAKAKVWFPAVGMERDPRLDAANAVPSQAWQDQYDFEGQPCTSCDIASPPHCLAWLQDRNAL